jgi:hypothetical protein
VSLEADIEPPPGELAPREIMERVEAAGGLFVFSHPNGPWPAVYADDALLETMQGMRGIEIYSGALERLPGEAKATDRWDRLLTRGWRLFGHATDNTHKADEDSFIAWNQVQWPREEMPTAPGLIRALAEGRFYASTGVTISRLGVEDDGSRVFVESDADEVRWVAHRGVIAKKVRNGSANLTIDEVPQLAAVKHFFGGATGAEFVRAECLGRGGDAAWTQPFWTAN